MVRYFKRGYKRRRGYRRKRMTKTNLLLNKSATSQAFQIAKLNRKINRVAKQNHIEIRQLITNPVTNIYTGGLLSDTYTYFEQPAFWPINGTSYNIRNLNFYFRLIYSPGKVLEPGSTIGYSGATVRIILFQAMSESLPEADKPSIDQFLAIVGNTGEKYVAQTMSPLKEGITAKYRVLADRRYNLSDANPIRNTVLRIKPRFNKLNYLSTNEGKPIEGYHPRGFIFGYIVTSGLTSSDTESMKVTYFGKLAYTDT